MQRDDRGFSTRAIHAHPPRTRIESAPVAPTLVQTSSFAIPDMDAMDTILDGDEPGYVYSRLGNPTVAMLETTVADLEGGAQGLAFGSGMAAIHAVATGLVQAGDHVIAPASVYGGTYALLAQILPRFGVETSFVDNRDLDAWRAAVRPSTRMIWAETLSNPTLMVADLPAIAEIAKAAGASLVVDATFTTPYLSRPLAQGADVVVHSASKYLGGHGDLLGGIAVAGADHMSRIRPSAIETGGAMAPFVAWLILRGLKTLSLRMDRHGASALAVAEALEAMPEVLRVNYPGLTGHPDHARAKATLPKGQGGVLSFEVDGGLEAARAAMDKMQLFLRAGSLGDAHSLCLLPATTSHRKLGPEGRAKAGISDGLIRLSIGLEEPEDLIADLRQALSS